MLHFDKSSTHLQRQVMSGQAVKLLSNTTGCFFAELVSCQSRLRQQQNWLASKERPSKTERN
jgi:hypothetical protein